MGTAALVLGIIGILLFGCIFGVLAIIFGSIGISRVNQGRATNRGAATAGIVLGIIAVVLWFIVLVAFL